MEFAHINIEPRWKQKNDSYIISNKHTKEKIADIIYWTKWKKWVLMPDEGTIYDQSCLEDIIKFIKSIEDTP